mgnify:FL=1|jgi:UDP-N-acetylmuramate dehydrogenase
MSDTDILGKLQDIVGSDNIVSDEPMRKHTTFRIGGNADTFVRPESKEQIAEILRLCRKQDVPYFILGNGSNLLVGDRGFRGVVINIMDNMNDIKVDGGIIKAQAGAMLIKVSRAARDNSLTGLEFASGIPGTIGGAIYMNAGAYGGEMKDVVTQVTAMDAEGEIYTFGTDELEFSYRHSVIQQRDLIVLDVTMKLAAGDQKIIDDRMSELAVARRTKQPLEYPSAGSTFKRPEGYFAGKLIMDAGLRGYRVGDAQVSEKHCGFVVNRGNATADDVIKLIDDVKAKVSEEYDVVLEPEVRMIGEF